MGGELDPARLSSRNLRLRTERLPANHSYGSPISGVQADPAYNPFVINAGGVRRWFDRFSVNCRAR